MPSRRLALPLTCPFMPPRSVTRYLLSCAGLLLGGGPAAAQSLPTYHSINPVAEARSGLYFQPYVPAGPGWRFETSLDYGSMVEYGLRLSLADTSYLLDTEALRLNLGISRDLGPRTFLLAEAWVGGAYGGFLDGFLEWYHGIFGIHYPERDARGPGEFSYRYRFPNGREERFARRGAYLGDARLGVGLRHGPRSQSVLSLTLPTNSAGDGYARGSVSLGLLNTFRVPLHPRLIYEGSFNAGYTPKHGSLREVEERVFFLGTSGARWRTVGRLWSFANLYLHSPYYSRADALQLDRWDLTIDFGWIIRSRTGREFRFGMSEDLWPSGPAIDATFRLGYSW